MEKHICLTSFIMMTSPILEELGAAAGYKLRGTATRFSPSYSQVDEYKKAQRRTGRGQFFLPSDVQDGPACVYVDEDPYLNHQFSKHEHLPDVLAAQVNNTSVSACVHVDVCVDTHSRTHKCVFCACVDTQAQATEPEAG